MTPRHAAIVLAALVVVVGGSAAAAGAFSADTVVSHRVGPFVPGGPRAAAVVPHDGLLDVHPVSPSQLSVGVAGGAHATVSWWSGVAPCAELSHVAVARQGHLIRITVYEGAAPGADACIEIAQLKSFRVDLRSLPSGTYHVVAGTRRATLRAG